MLGVGLHQLHIRLAPHAGVGVVVGGDLKGDLVVVLKLLDKKGVLVGRRPNYAVVVQIPQRANLRLLLFIEERQADRGNCVAKEVDDLGFVPLALFVDQHACCLVLKGICWL